MYKPSQYCLKQPIIFQITLIALRSLRYIIFSDVKSKFCLIQILKLGVKGGNFSAVFSVIVQQLYLILDAKLPLYHQQYDFCRQYTILQTRQLYNTYYCRKISIWQYPHSQNLLLEFLEMLKNPFPFSPTGIYQHTDTLTDGQTQIQEIHG